MLKCFPLRLGRRVSAIAMRIEPHLDIESIKEWRVHVPLSMVLAANSTRGKINGIVWDRWDRVVPYLSIPETWCVTMAIVICMDGVVINYDLYQRYVGFYTNPNRIKRYTNDIDDILSRRHMATYVLPKCLKWHKGYTRSYVYQKDAEFQMRLAFSRFKGMHTCSVCGEKKKTLCVNTTAMCKQCYLVILFSTL